jgi:SET domain-containing protein
LSPIHGTGVFARRTIGKGERVGVIRGRILPRFRLGKGPQHVIGLDAGHLVPQARPMGLWLLNHSCQPNSVLVRKPGSVDVLALRAIREGAEITCDYRPTYYDGRLRCRCGARGCGGKI